MAKVLKKAAMKSQSAQGIHETFLRGPVDPGPWVCLQVFLLLHKFFSKVISQHHQEQSPETINSRTFPRGEA